MKNNPLNDRDVDGNTMAWMAMLDQADRLLCLCHRCNAEIEETEEYCDKCKEALEE